MASQYEGQLFIHVGGHKEATNGGWAALLLFMQNGKWIPRIISGASDQVISNCHLNLMALTAALEVLKRPVEMRIVTDKDVPTIRHAYIEGMYEHWVTKEFKQTGSTDEIPYKDLWIKAHTLLQQHTLIDVTPPRRESEYRKQVEAAASDAFVAHMNDHKQPVLNAVAMCDILDDIKDGPGSGKDKVLEFARYCIQAGMPCRVDSFADTFDLSEKTVENYLRAFAKENGLERKVTVGAGVMYA